VTERDFGVSPQSYSKNAHRLSEAVIQVDRRFFIHQGTPRANAKRRVTMAIVLIFPALMLLTLVGVAVLGLDTPPVERTVAPEMPVAQNEGYQLAA
jgi:hypothetical protein